MSDGTVIEFSRAAKRLRQQRKRSTSRLALQLELNGFSITPGVHYDVHRAPPRGAFKATGATFDFSGSDYQLAGADLSDSDRLQLAAFLRWFADIVVTPIRRREQAERVQHAAELAAADPTIPAAGKRVRGRCGRVRDVVETHKAWTETLDIAPERPGNDVFLPEGWKPTKPRVTYRDDQGKTRTVLSRTWEGWARGGEVLPRCPVPVEDS